MKNCKVLLLEDEPISRKVITDTLLEAGYQVDSYESAELALEKMDHSEGAYQLAVLDKIMPGMDGVDFLKEALSNNELANTPIVMLTAVRDNDEIIYALDAGIHEYLTKPVDLEQLLSLASELTQA